MSKNETKEVKRCPECGAIVNPKDEKCPSCGAPLREEVIPRERMIEYLIQVPGLDQEMAESLYDAGYTSLMKVKSAKASDMKEIGIEPGLADKLRGFTPTMSLHKEKRDEVPTPGEEQEMHLEKGFTYLIKEERTKRSYEMFENALNSGMKGFCVTRNYPLKIKAKHDLKDTLMIWLSSIGKENSLRPKDLEKLSFSLDQFISHEGGIILLDGLEYLITNNNFLTVLRFLQSLRDQVAVNNSVLLLALNPSTLEPSELNLLEKEVDVTI